MSKRRGGPTSRQQSNFMQRFSGKLTTTTPSGEHRRIGGGDDSNKNNRRRPPRGNNLLNKPGGYGNNNNNNTNTGNIHNMMPPQGNQYHSFAPPPGALPPNNNMMGRPGVNDLRNVAMEQPMGFDYGDHGINKSGIESYGNSGANGGGSFVYQMPNVQTGGGRKNNIGGGMGRPMASAGARRVRGGARGGGRQHSGMHQNKPQRPGTFHGYQRRENRNEELANSSPNGQLYFSRQSRQVNFRPKTLAEYKRLQPNEYVELGKLPADLNSTELIAKRANKERVKDFSRNLRAINQRMIRKSRNRQPREKEKKLSVRQKARMYAQNIPKPRGFNRDTPLSRMSRKENINDGYNGEEDDENGLYNDINTYGVDNNMSQLDQLEMEHQNSRYDVDAIRREYGF